MNLAERITEHARSIRPAQTLSRIALAPFWLTGIIIGSITVAIWNAGRWAWAAVAVGIRETTGGKLPRPQPAVVAQFALAVAILVAAVAVILN